MLLLLLHLITLNYTYTIGTMPPDEGSGRRGGLNLYNTHYSQETNIRAPGGILTRNYSKREAADLRLGVRLHWSQNRHNKANQHLSAYTS